MEEIPRLLFEQLGISVLLGLLVGLQRQRTESVIAGVRTFPLVTLLGAIAAALDQSTASGGWVIAAGLVAVASIVVITNAQRLRGANPDYGMTTEAAVLLMFGVGAYVVVGERIVAIAVGAGTAVLLQFKPELHGVAARLGDEDLRAIMTFVLITCVVLPVLPDTTYDVVSPLDVINPFETWLMIVLMVGISLGGYLIYKFFGQNASILLGGILGGAISSTATTVSYAKRSVDSPGSVRLAALVILIASTVVYARVLLELSIVAPNHLHELAAPIVILMSVNAIVALVVWIRLRKRAEDMPEQRNPTELRSAIVFGLLYAGVLMALSAAKTYFDSRGLYAIAALSGLTDMDAITLSTGRLVQMRPDSGGISADAGWRIIVVASMSNLLFKIGIAAVAGHRHLFRYTALLFAVPFVVGALLLWQWPM